MKIKLLIIITILIQLACQQEKSDLQQSWILVEKDRIKAPKNTFLPIYRGFLYHFEDKKCSISYITSKQTYKPNYTLEDNYIKADSGIFGQIQHISKDSLVLNEKGDFVYKLRFLPLENTNFITKDKALIIKQLLSNSWKLNDTLMKYEHKFFFNEKPVNIHRLGKNDDIKYLVTETKVENHKHLSNYSPEWWILRLFEGKLILCYSHQGGIENSYFQITDYSENEIKGKFLHYYKNDWQNSTMLKSEPLESKEHQQLKQSITGNWEIYNLYSPTKDRIDYYKTNAKHHAFRGINRYENQVTITDLEERNLRFSFKENGEYEIFANKKLIRKGTNWEVINDGSYIYLDDKLYGSDFIEIQSAENNLLKIRFTKYISTPIKYGNEFIHFELEMLLRNVEYFEQ